MKRNGIRLACLLATIGWACAGYGQGMPTALQTLQLSAFGAASGVYTGLDDSATQTTQGKNISITFGGDLALAAHHGLRPTIEVRGTYPVDKGTVDDQKSILGGLRLDFRLGHRVHPYGDFLFGRGSTDYPTGYLYNNFAYDLTTTFVYSPGAGVDFDLGEHLAIKVDGQFQKWGNAPTTSGTIYSKQGNVGLVYKFDFNRHRHR